MATVTRGIIPKAKKVVIYGPEGIGKSTFAAHFPEPIFVDTEGSTAAMDVARIEPQSWSELLAVVKDIISGNVDAPCRTLVIDTADWAEAMCAESVCAKNRWQSISSPGYGTGYRVNWEEFGNLMNLLSDAVPKGINVVITAHAMMRKFEQPDEAGSYDRWEMKLQNSPKANIAAMVKEWADMVLFANYKTIVADKDKQGKGKAQGGRRVMYTEHHPCWDAKNRYGLPDMMDFSYEGIRPIIEQGANAPAQAPAHAQAVTSPPQTRQPKAPATRAKPSKEDASPALTAFAAKKVEEYAEKQKAAQKAAEAPAEPVKNAAGIAEKDIDPAIPEKVRRLMIQHGVGEWDIQNVVSVKGYFPFDMAIRDYPAEFIDGWIVPHFDKIAEMAQSIKDKAEIPFN